MTLENQGICVPNPASYRNQLRNAARELKGRAASPAYQSGLLGNILNAHRPKRMVLSWENFAGFAQSAVREQFYIGAGERMRTLCQLFPEAETSFYFSIRNPATFLPAISYKQGKLERHDFAQNIRPLSLRWSDTVINIRAANPGVPMTIWCDEDVPLLWPDILRAVSGYSGTEPLSGEDEMLRSLLSPEGLEKLDDYMQNYPPKTAARRQHVQAAFLDRYALEDRMHADADLPGWDQSMVDVLSAAYEQDLERIASIRDVTILRPEA